MRSPFFGKLKEWGQSNLLLILKSLEAAGYLERVGNPEYPCLGLSPAGQGALRDGVLPELAMPEMRSAGAPERVRTVKRRVAAVREKQAERVLFGSDEELFEHLRKIHHVPRIKESEFFLPPFFTVFASEIFTAVTAEGIQKDLFLYIDQFFDAFIRDVHE